MDVNMMSYRVTDDRWVKVAYPLKLAYGRSVVSVQLEMLLPHANVIRLASDDDAWEGAVDEALTRGGAETPAHRMAVHLDHSWDARAHQLLNWLSGLPEKKSARLARQTATSGIEAASP